MRADENRKCSLCLISRKALKKREKPPENIHSKVRWGADEQAGKMMEGEPVGREERKERKEGRRAGRRRRRDEAERNTAREFNKVVILVLLM